METQVITVSPLEPLVDVQRLFFEEEINGAPVVDDNGRILGMITSSDLLRAAAEAHDTERSESQYVREIFDLAAGDFMADLSAEFEQRLGEITAADVMTDAVLTVDREATVAEVARTMRAHRVHRVLVVEDSQLCGIISTFDLVALLEKQD